MNTRQPSDDSPLFGEAALTPAPVPARSPAWKVLLVDDEPAVHGVTRLALEDVDFDGRPVEFLQAFSAVEGERVFAEHPDVAVAFVDVVMETDHAGLDLVRTIREKYGNRLTRVVLRTGQPGQAPEDIVIREYDINDYKDKTELTAQKLTTTLLTSLRSYRDMSALDASRKGLRRVIEATGEIFRIRGLRTVIQGVLEQLVAILYLERDSMLVGRDALAVETSGAPGLSVVAGTGKYSDLVGRDAGTVLVPEQISVVQECLREKKSVIRDREYAGYFGVRSGHEDVLYVIGLRALSAEDVELTELFLRNAALAYEHGLLRDETERTLYAMVCMLGEAIETRTQSGSRHVRRVGEFGALIARGLGLSEQEVEILMFAAPLHDVGKISVPEAVLHKPGPLDAGERAMAQVHALSGEAMLSRVAGLDGWAGQPEHTRRVSILKAAATIAGGHHERWDGTGYPRGLAGEAIPVMARVVAAADVFDTLADRRSYKTPWPVEDIFAYFEAERGRQFDPAIVDWILGHREAMCGVLEAYRDADPDLIDIN